MVGLGGCSTGDGLFTLKPLHAEVWVCAYAPTAPFEVLTPGQVDEAGDHDHMARQRGWCGWTEVFLGLRQND